MTPADDTPKDEQTETEAPATEAVADETPAAEAEETAAVEAGEPEAEEAPAAEAEEATAAAAATEEPEAEAPTAAEAATEEPEAEAPAPKPRRSRARKAAEAPAEAEAEEAPAEKPKRAPRRGRKADETPAETPKPAPRPAPRTNGRPVVQAHAKYVRTSARKARLVCDQVRGKSVAEARAILAHTPRAVARDWAKLLESAVANAEHNHELLGDDLRIVAITADEGPTLKRFRPRAMGRATRIRKRTAHLSIALTPKEQ